MPDSPIPAADDSTDRMPGVGIVIVNWNNWRDTCTCLRSLEAMRYRSFDPIVIDNGSTDDSASRIRAELPHVTLVETERNLGFGAGSNLGIEIAAQNGREYVWLLNNDAVAHEDALGALVRVAEADRSIGAVGSAIYDFVRRDRLQAAGGGRIWPRLGIERHETAFPVRRLDWITGASMLLRSSAVSAVGGFDESFFMYWEDADLCYRLRAAGWKLAVAPESRVWHRGGAAKMDPVHDRSFNASAALFFRRHASWPLVPIWLGAGGRVVKRLARGRVASARGVVDGAREGWRQAAEQPAGRRD